MNQGRGEDGESAIAGRPIEDAADLVVERGNAENREAVRRVLEEVTEDGIVSWDGAREAFANVSKVVATPETRLELAARELTIARDAAEPVEDLPIVRTRLERYEARFDQVESRIGDLSEELRRLLDREEKSGALFEVAQGIRQLKVEANNCQRMADELQVDLQNFQRWLDDPTYRYRELEADIDALEDSLDELAATANAVANERDDGNPEGQDEPHAKWFDAVVQTRVLRLVFEDLRWELAELQNWAERVGSDGDSGDEIASRIEDLEAQLVSNEDRLDDLSRPTWQERMGEDLEAIESDLRGFEPPIEWTAVEAVLE